MRVNGTAKTPRQILFEEYIQLCTALTTGRKMDNCMAQIVL